MPKKVRGLNFGRKTKNARASEKRRRNPDLVAADNIRVRDYRRWRSQEIRLKKEDRLRGFIELGRLMVKFDPFSIVLKR